MFAKETFKSQPLAREQLCILRNNMEAEELPFSLLVHRVRLLTAGGRR